MAELYNSQLDAFELYHEFVAPRKRPSLLEGPALPALGHALAGATGSAISNVVTYPLNLIVTRLQIQRQLRNSSLEVNEDQYKSIQDAAEKIYRGEGGIIGLYAGLLQDTTKSIADSFLFFLAYTFVRQSRLRNVQGRSQHLPVFDELAVGFVAGAFSKFLTTPIANVVTRLQTSAMVTARSSDSNMVRPTSSSLAKQIYAEKGLQGFWSGYSASLVLTLNPSLTFFFFETFKRLILPKSRRSSPPPSATFLLAALSKALASTITYPFSLAKARAQVSSKVPSENQPNAMTGAGKDTNLARAAFDRTIFATIIEIARTGGISALYEGLSGEVLKGFFSHGITMILKDAVHKTIIRLYYSLLKVARRYPSPQELAKRAKEHAQQAMEATQSGVESAGEFAQELGRKGVSSFTAGNASDGAKAGVDS